MPNRRTIRNIAFTFIIAYHESVKRRYDRRQGVHCDSRGDRFVLQSQQSTHIAHLVLGLPMGGTEGLVDKMMRQPPEGFRTSAICLDEIGVIGEAAIRDGFKVSLIKRGKGINWSLPAVIAAHCRKHSIHILHCHHYTPWFYGIMARLFLPRLKVIMTEHGRLYPDIPSAKRRIFNRLFLPLTHSITAVSPAVAQTLQKVEGFPLKRIQVIYNGVDRSRFANIPDRAELRQKLGLNPSAVYFILCSRLDPIKWIEGLIDAFQLVRSEISGCGLILVGDGPEKEKIKRIIASLALDGDVILPGYRTDIPEWLAASDVFVLSSLSEGTSVSLIESMACGLPSIVTNVGGNPYVSEDGITGIVVPPVNVDALADGMTRLGRDANLRHSLGCSARTRFENTFEINSMFQGYARIYQSLTCAE
jgi:L-malate glycosyltransferase